MSSQSGVKSLETHVHGLEMGLMKFHMIWQYQVERIRKTNSIENTCCKLHIVEFSSSKFWSRVGCWYATSCLFFLGAFILLFAIKHTTREAEKSKHQKKSWVCCEHVDTCLLCK
jgi:hypothetical protein